MCAILLLFAASLSLSLGSDVAENRNVSLSLYGGGITNGSWSTAFHFERRNEDISTSWNLRLNYSVSGQGKDRRLTVKGIFIDDGVDAIDPIYIKLLPVEAEKVTNKNCYDQEGGEGSAVKIVTRKELNLTELNANLKPRSKAADYLIIDASRYEKDRTDFYVSWLKERYADEIKYYGGFRFNYLISDDGNVFEGAGWDITTNVLNGGLEPISLRISFVKEKIYDSPSPAAIAKLKSLIRTALCLGMLSPNYKLIPYFHIYDPYNLPADHFERETIKEWVQYAADVDLGVNDVVQFPIAFREEWNWTRPLRPLDNLSLPVEVVIVRNDGGRCFTSEYCIFLTKWYSKFITTENFLIGDDGRAYENRGWDYAPIENVGGKSIIVVVFYGEYNSYLPSPRAFNAFNSLLRLGVLWGKLSPNYKVASYRSYENDHGYRGLIGDMLHEEVLKMERYTDEI